MIQKNFLLFNVLIMFNLQVKDQIRNFARHYVMADNNEFISLISIISK